MLTQLILQFWFFYLKHGVNGKFDIYSLGKHSI